LFIVQGSGKVLLGAWEGTLDALVRFQATTWGYAQLTVYECTQPELALLDAVVRLTGSSCGWHESEFDSQPQLQAALELAELLCMRKPTPAKVDELEAALFEATGRCPQTYSSGSSDTM
jgi:hypothetical protein